MIERHGYSHTGEDCEPYETEADYFSQGKKRFIVHTKPSRGIPGLLPPYEKTGQDFVVGQVEESGGWRWTMIHISRLLGKK